MSSRRTIVLTSLAAIALVCSGIVVQGFRPGAEGSDLEIFARYASQMLDGRIPYRDFSVEYPPGALAPMIVPYFGHPSLDAYAVRFGILIVVLLAATAVACATIVRTTHGSNERLVRSVLVIAFSPLLLGAFVLKRFDALPSLLTVVSLLLVERRRSRSELQRRSSSIQSSWFQASWRPRLDGRGETPGRPWARSWSAAV
jgi:hypothetical protein